MLIGDSPRELIFIRIAIFVFRLVAPLSLLYCLTFIIVRPLGFLRQLWLLPLHIWIFAEAAFFVLVYLPLKSVFQRPAAHPDPLSKEDRGALIKRCFDDTASFESYLSKWFLGSPLSEIKRENVKEFYAWSLMDQTYRDSTGPEFAELDSYVDQLEGRLGQSFDGGWGKAQCLKLTLDTVPMQHRPLIWYAVSIAGLERGWSHRTDL